MSISSVSFQHKTATRWYCLKLLSLEIYIQNYSIALKFERRVCQISMWCDNSKNQSRGCETSRDLTIRRLIGYWNKGQDAIHKYPDVCYDTWWRHQMEHFPRYWSCVRGIHRSPVNSPHKGQWRGALMFSLICDWINSWVNNREVGDLSHHRAHFDIIVMTWMDYKYQYLKVEQTYHLDSAPWGQTHLQFNLDKSWDEK